MVLCMWYLYADLRAMYMVRMANYANLRVMYMVPRIANYTDLRANSVYERWYGAISASYLYTHRDHYTKTTVL